jgi:hypothetical protein
MKQGFLRDKDGNLSSKRLESFISFLVGMGILIYGAAIRDASLNPYAWTALGFAGALQGITVFQR